MPQDNDDYIALSVNVASQVEQWQKIVFEDLEKQTIIVNEMINPTYFENDLSNFPIDWDQV